MPKRTQDVPALFWSRVDKGSESECWLWTGRVTSHAWGEYGRFWVTDVGYVRAHRYSYELVNGPLPDGLFVMHACDNPRCVNPAHLSTGTHTDNMRDMATKGRSHWSQITECTKGHPYAGSNLRVDSKGHRFCRTCATESSRRSRARKRDAA